MKSTVKIDYETRGIHMVPIIKIVQPIDMVKASFDEQIEDVKDKLIADFLHTPVMKYRNEFFQVTEHRPYPDENSTIFITKIAAIEENSLFLAFKRTIIGKLIHWEWEGQIQEIVNAGRVENVRRGEQPAPEGFSQYLKIHEFFDWLAMQNYHDNTDKHTALWAEGRLQLVDEVNNNIPKYPEGKRFETVRDFYELVLPQEARIAAFENTSKIKLDQPANNIFEAIMRSFYIADTPQGAGYWQGIMLEYSN